MITLAAIERRQWMMDNELTVSPLSAADPNTALAKTAAKVKIVPNFILSVDRTRG
jgi:hypothetical protein